MMGPMKIVIAMAALLACSAVPSAQTKKPAARELYVTMCQMCHGPEGKAPIKEMGFVGRKWKHGTKTADMIKVVTNGVPGTAMMPFEGRLTEQEIRDLARYVRSLDKTLKPEKR
jgi:mono/diheme cytochrome c family protein